MGRDSPAGKGSSKAVPGGDCAAFRRTDSSGLCILYKYKGCIFLCKISFDFHPYDDV